MELLVLVILMGCGCCRNPRREGTLVLILLGRTLRGLCRTDLCDSGAGGGWFVLFPQDPKSASVRLDGDSIIWLRGRESDDNLQ